MDVIAMVQSLSDAAGAALKEAQQHEALKNSPAMQQAYVLDQLQAQIDSIRSTISNEDLQAYRLAVGAAPSQ